MNRVPCCHAVVVFVCLVFTHVTTAASLTRDEVDYINRVHFFQMAMSAAKVERVKKQSLYEIADRDQVRATKLYNAHAMSEIEYRRSKYRALAAEFEVQESDHTIRELQMDAEMNAQYARWESGEPEDLSKMGNYYLKRWENLLDLNLLAKKKAQAFQELAEFENQAIAKHRAKGMVSAREIDDAETAVAMSKAAFDLACERIAESERAIETARKTIDRAKAEAKTSRNNHS